MINQHAKWLEATVATSHGASLPALNLVLSSHVWRQDHNDSLTRSWLDIMLNKSFNNDHITNIYFPADANLLLAVGEKCYTSTNCINAPAGKQPAGKLSTRLVRSLQLVLREWKRASNAEAGEGDIAWATCGDVPTQSSAAP